MDTFTPWTIVVDLGIISALMLLGKLIRVKVKGIQKFLIIPAVLAGIMALVLGPEVLGWLPLSGSLGTYAGILIAFVFGVTGELCQLADTIISNGHAIKQRVITFRGAELSAKVFFCIPQIG